MKNTTLNPIDSSLEVTSIFEVEEPDTIGDPEGVEERQAAQQTAQAPQLIPSFIEKDFEFRRGHKDQPVDKLIAEGKRAYFLQPRVSAVEKAIADAQLAVTAAMDSATETERDAAVALAAEVKDVDYTLGGLDQWLGDLVKRAIARQAASDAVFIARGVDMLSGWNAQTDNAMERKESFENTLFSAQKRLAVLLLTLHTTDSQRFLNLKAAAWQRMQAEARKNQQKYLHAEEYHAMRSLQGEHAKEGQRATHSLLLGKRAA